MIKRIVSGAFLLLSGVLVARCGGDDAAGPGVSGTNTGSAGSAGTAGAGGSNPDASVQTGGSAGSVGTGGAAGAGGGGGSCKLTGDACTTDTDCCTSMCNPQTKVCSTPNGPGMCRAAGSPCAIPQNCCTFVCNGGVCGTTQCTSDNQACTTSAQCCSGTCGAAGTCTPLNPGCRTAGNACMSHGDCCSRACLNGLCSGGGSFCTQNTDVCASNFECCSGICTKAQGATLGLCTSPHPPGIPGCAVAGEVCGVGASTDGGGVVFTDAGLPACGGECCSRACAPYRAGVLICQPPSGCRPTGEVCRNDIDCCGFGGIQGQTGVGNCSKSSPSDPVGRCDNGNACRPAGAICKLRTMSCNAENNCCAGNVNQNPLVCQQDLLGIPRCTMKGEACTDGGSRAGQACATSADCCGLPCVPNPGGMPPLVCGPVCVGNGGLCTTGADCCPGLPCIMPPGSTRGTCGQPPPPDGGVPPPPDGGVPPPPDGGGGYDGSVPPDAPADGPRPCTMYGQLCTMSSECCDGVPCTNGRCLIIVN